MRYISKTSMLLLLTLPVGLMESGCAGRKAVKKTAGIQQPPATAQTVAQDYSARTSLPDFAAVYFDFEKASIKEEAKKTLQKNAERLKTNADSKIEIEGHCDERGTIEYNMALGQRRADAVQKYYKALGVNHNRMRTVSYGEERPVCTESSENCWQKNRRSETKPANERPIGR